GGPSSPGAEWPGSPVAEVQAPAAGGPGAPGPPPTSPAYSAPVSAAYAPDYAPPDPHHRPPATAPPPLVAPPTREKRGGGRRSLLLVGAAVAVVAAIVAGFVVTRSGDDDPGLSFGEVGAASGSAVVRTAPGEDARPLEEGEVVLAGWEVEATGGAVAVELAEGGVLRFDTGATVTFTDLSRDPETGETSGEPEPVIEVEGGRTWFNPAGEAATAEIPLRLPDGELTSDGNPVAVDCSGSCMVEAPAGGVTLTTGEAELTPAPNEVVTIEGAGTLDLNSENAPSAWAQQNLDADAEADLPEPEAVDTGGVKALGAADGTYFVTLTVTGPPGGDGIPEDLKYQQGEVFNLSLVVDGAACSEPPCDVSVSANDGASGTAHVESAAISLDFTQPIDCFDETFTTVVVPNIGTTTVHGDLEVTGARQDGDRWVATSFEGTGTLGATLSTACNEGEVLGTATSPITISGNLSG
ncbi:MAG TPA: hypothetical protein VFI47_21165, partial [Acidimicrobiales bacterium]|nr:hypothetical protein [Acidimicrobiales bacterium]